MWKSAYSNRKNSDENEIIQFISDSKLKDRSLLIEYISKLQMGGLYIQHVQSLINFCEEAMVLNIIEQEKKDNETNRIEENQDDIATWYCGDEIKNTPSKKAVNQSKIRWIPYNFETNKKIECARKNGFNYVGIGETHYLYLKLKLQKSCDRKLKSCLTIKREPPVNQQGQDQQPLEEDKEFEIESDEDIDDDDEPIEVKWYWADDSLTGAQDTWVVYNSELCKQLENDYQTKAKQQIRVDSERYVDTIRMLQVRYDSRFRVRMVKRVVGVPSSSSSSSSSPKTGALKKMYNLMSVFSISKSTSSPSPSVENKHGFKELPFAKTFKKVKVNSIPFILTVNQLDCLYRSLLKYKSSKRVQVSTTTQQSQTKLKLYVLDKFKISLLKNNNILHSIPY